MKRFLGVLVVPAIAASISYGQAISVNGGSIQGTITDSTGAVVPNAQVVITGTDTGFTKTITTDSSGFYSVGPLNPGPYTVDVTAANFQKLDVKTVVRTGTATSGNFKLTVGQTNETVEVTAGQIQVNTDQAGVSGVITREQIESLPINGRNILDVAQIQPGVILQSGESFDPTKAGYSAISVGGVSGRTTRILLDGQDITDETVGTTIFNVPTGAVDEFQLNRSTQDVSGEVTSTGQVLLSTQSGTNTYHGQLFYYFQDQAVGFASTNGLDAPFQRNQFGGSVGGPIIKDKLFFFGDIERIKQAASNAAQVTPAFAAIQAQYPYIPAPFHDTYSTLRLDYNGPKGVHLFARGTYSVNADDSAFGFIYSVYQNRDNIPALVGGADFTTGKFTHSFRGGYEKFHNLLEDGTAALGTSIYNPSTPTTGPVTLYDPYDAGGFFAGVNYLSPQQTYQSDKQLRYDGTWTRGAHSIKFGYSINHILGGGFAEFFGASLFTQFGSFNVLANCDGVAGAAPCPNDPSRGYSAVGYVVGNGFGSFSAIPGFGLPGGGVHDWREGAYLADTWKAAPYFTVVAGLRWSVDTDRANQYLPSPLCSSVATSLQFTGCTGSTYLFDQYQVGLGGKTHQPYANFGPQVGFVFSPGDHKTSIRAGAGIFYENTVFNDEGNAGPAVIQAKGQFQNSGNVCFGSSSAFLPGLGTVNSVNGVPLSTICGQSINQAAPQLNALKAQYQAAVAGSTAANPSFIGTGGGLIANGIYGKPYVNPYSIQINGGVQRELVKGLILSMDYVHNATLKAPLTIDVNHVGAARYLDIPSAQAAIAAATLAAGCSGGYSAAAINCAIAAGTTFDNTNSTLNFGNFGLTSSSVPGGGPAAASGYAFGGRNRNVGLGRFILPIGRSGYDAAQFVLQEQRAHPVPGIVNSNFQISYTLSRVVSAAAGNNNQDQFFNPNAIDNDNPNEYIGRNTIDHSNEVSFGGSLDVKYGVRVGVVGHFFSAPPTTLTLDNTAGGGQQIFQTDVTGDGTTGDLVPGTLPGSYMHRIKGARLSQLINTYNTQEAGTPTPAGQALIAAGLFTPAQLSFAHGVQQQIAPAPTSPLQNPAFRTFDTTVSYPIRLGKLREGLSLEPAVSMYNVTNMSNFSVPTGTLLNVADATAANGGVGFLNGPDMKSVQNANRVQRGSGTFDQGAPRTTEFQLKLNF